MPSVITSRADRPGTRSALIGFGLPGPLIAPLGIVAPVAELAIGVALLPTRTTWFAAIAGLALLVVFLAVIGFSLASGRRPDCHCFGQIRSAPVGPSTVALNVGLIAVVGIVIWQGRDDPSPSVMAWINPLTTAELVGLSGGVVGFGLLAGIAALMWQVLRQQGRLLLRLDELEARLLGNNLEPVPEPEYDPSTRGVGLPIGERAPDFELDALVGKRVTLKDLLAGRKPVLLFFANPDCGPCEALVPEIAAWQRKHVGSISMALVSEGSREANRNKIAVHGLEPILIQRNQEISERYQAWSTPSALLIQPEGAIGTRVAQGADAIRKLVAWAALLSPSANTAQARMAQLNNGSGAAPPGVPRLSVGDSAPPLRLSDLSGKIVDVTNLRSRKLLLFWNPLCSFCKQMLGDLRNWDANRPVDAPELLVISVGPVEENRAMNLRAPVLLDHGFRAGALYGAGGTPMAILLDEEGHISSEMAAGAAEVLALAGASGVVHH